MDLDALIRVGRMELCISPGQESLLFIILLLVSQGSFLVMEVESHQMITWVGGIAVRQGRPLGPGASADSDLGTAVTLATSLSFCATSSSSRRLPSIA